MSIELAVLRGVLIALYTCGQVALAPSVLGLVLANPWPRC